MSRVLLVLYSALMALVLVLTAPWWLWQMGRTGKYREGMRERLGQVPARLARPASGCVWIHAVSVGEVLAASRLIEELDRALEAGLNTAPAARPAVYLSTTTRTGQALARERFGSNRVFYFPLDFAFSMRAWLGSLRPSVVVLVESEFWPRMLTECHEAAVPVAVVNARVSDRSWPRYQRLRMLWRPFLGSLALVLAQSEEDARRLRLLGAARAVAGGNLKYDIRVAGASPFAGMLRAQVSDGARLVVCGSTLAGEEELLLRALPLRELVTVFAPRHPERFEEVARLLEGTGLRCLRRSTWSTRSELPLAPGTLLLLDSIGELAGLYSLAEVAIVGGGFLWPGGHNPLEPAQFGVPTLIGAHYANFREVVEALREAEAIAVASPDELASAVSNILTHRQQALAMGQRARQVFEQQAGATQRALTALLALCEASRPSAQSEAVQVAP